MHDILVTKTIPNERLSRRKVPLVFFVFILLALSFDSASARIVGGGHQNREEEKNADDTSSFNVSTIVPSLRDTTELAHLSSLVYSFRSADKQDCSSFPSIYEDYIARHQPPVFIDTDASYTCHMYECNEQDTQVLVLSRNHGDSNGEDHGYIAIIYAGTDDFRTFLADTDIRTTTFGPEIDGKHPLAPSEDVRVHAGFNNQVFRKGLFDRVKETVMEAKRLNPKYRIFTTGHSLGAANADLTAVAMKMQPEWKDELILSVNFGSPKTGNTAWKEFVNSVEGLGIWRVVNGHDLVPRMPGIRFHHVGHTVQLDPRIARAFWLHEGDQSLGYSGVPFGWNSYSFVLAPEAAIQHMIGRYTKYLEQKSTRDENKFYVAGFEKCRGYDDDDDTGDALADDDMWSNIPDDYILHEEDAVIEDFFEQYLALKEMEENGVDIDSFDVDGLFASSGSNSETM